MIHMYTLLVRQYSAKGEVLKLTSVVLGKDFGDVLHTFRFLFRKSTFYGIDV